MYRYYVSFNYRTASGLGLSAADVTVPTRITTAKDVERIRDYFAAKTGYQNLMVLAFSEYGS
ncbi:hypothetical protein Val02_14070 [Virgisporangium aliadipatigenens]|uniref:Uncharacterized protein n=1 Tax=Virgisporangium aliadipatigenens TaxID=741659 RepID=A0A8J3YGB4_9ACTN|nr:hypothetical protein [Virgisporangium aliadipatigenens]GIJ44521.1 hypothetical protein Val02_14070 [Virgisporangium aliadipatigenens]